MRYQPDARLVATSRLEVHASPAHQSEGQDALVREIARRDNENDDGDDKHRPCHGRYGERQPKACQRRCDGAGKCRVLEGTRDDREPKITQYVRAITACLVRCSTSRRSWLRRQPREMLRRVHWPDSHRHTAANALCRSSSTTSVWCASSGCNGDRTGPPCNPTRSIAAFTPAIPSSPMIFAASGVSRA